MVRYIQTPKSMANPEHSTRHTPKDLRPRWDMDSIGEVLNAKAKRAQDAVFGEGERFALGPTGRNIVELFPGSQAVRITTDFARIVLYAAGELQLSQQGITLGHGDTHVTVTPEGDVALTIGSPDMVGASAASTSEEAAGPDQSFERSQPKSDEQKERLTVLGRVGATPSFRTSPKGTLIARFPVAVHEAENKTTWHTVLAFGERAEKLKESLEKGGQVEVVGYRHFREARTRNGQPKTVEELYAVVVKNR